MDPVKPRSRKPPLSIANLPETVSLPPKDEVRVPVKL